MNAASVMFKQATLWDSTGATSSPGSEDGNSLSSSLVCQPASHVGQEAVHASPSRLRGSKRESKTSVTCGRFSATSSESASLQLSLENRLRARLDTVGSMEYSQTWKRKTTPAGLSYLAHTASARRISDKDCTGWPTPMVNDELDSGYCYGRKKEGEDRKKFLKLPGATKMAGWSTPNTPSGGPVTKKYETHHGGLDLDGQAIAYLSGWATPRTEDAESAGMRHSRGTADTLSAQAGQDLQGWPTPNVMGGGKRAAAGIARTSL